MHLLKDVEADYMGYYWDTPRKRVKKIYNDKSI